MINKWKVLYNSREKCNSILFQKIKLSWKINGQLRNNNMRDIINYINIYH